MAVSAVVQVQKVTEFEEINHSCLTHVEDEAGAGDISYGGGVESVAQNLDRDLFSPVRV